MHLLLQKFHGPKVTCFAFDLRMVDTVAVRPGGWRLEKWAGKARSGAGRVGKTFVPLPTAANVARMKTNKVCNVQWKMAACSFANMAKRGVRRSFNMRFPRKMWQLESRRGWLALSCIRCQTN